tara:strand:+ start:509 stop:676 length:168 start_codon:yes stop_codon:yes gene_type:complete
MTEKSLNKLEPKKETPEVKEIKKEYPIWQGIDKAELGVNYIDHNGNLIMKGKNNL